MRDRFQAMASLGAGELRGAYQDRKQRIKAKADRKRQQAKGAIARARIKAMEAKEMADLETAMYEAQIAAQKARVRAKKARHEAGVYTTGERLGKFARSAADVGGAFVKGLTTPDKPRRATRKSTKRRSR